MKRPPDTFATRLAALRQAGGLNQSELARAAGLAQSTVLRLESGDREPSWAVVQMLAAALGVSITEFLITNGRK